MKRRRLQEEKSAVELAEEAAQLLRAAPGSALVGYYLGTLPFVLALLFFWSDMARSAFAHERLPAGVLVLTVLFIWMKCWHGVFARQLLAHLCGEPPPRPSPVWWLRVAAFQAIVQPLGLFVLPVSIALLVPLGWTYAYFANATIFSGGEIGGVRALVRKSWRQACQWSLQNHYVVFLFKLFGLFVFLNVMSAVMAVPFLMKILLGMETVFSQSPWAAMNTTMLAAAACLTFLCVDPLLKATYVLRCFYGESLRTGQDLQAELKSFATPLKPAALALLLVFSCASVTTTFAADQSEPSRNTPHATRGSLSPSALDRSIDEVIQRREYSWRLPREAASAKADDSSNENFLQRCFKHLEKGLKSVALWLRDVIEWIIRRLGGGSTASTGGLSFAKAMKGLLILLLIALAVLLGWLLFRLWRRSHSVEEVAVTTLAPAPNVADENVGAEQLPEDGWSRLARELLERGELRLALRAFYLAALAHLAERNLITLARYKSNRDYERELARRGHALAGVPDWFAENVAAFERVWYGRHGVTPDLLQHFAGNVEKIKAGA
jgi:hypothetical protein